MDLAPVAMLTFIFGIVAVFCIVRFFAWLSRPLNTFPETGDVAITTDRQPIYMAAQKAAHQAGATEGFQSLIATAYNTLPLDLRDKPGLFEVFVAMWALESGWGKSSLASAYHNYGGMKWREEMRRIAAPQKYRAHDGVADYCSFANIQDFVEGFIIFLDRSPYKGWRDLPNGEAFIDHIAETWAPNQNYERKVLALAERIRLTRR